MTQQQEYNDGYRHGKADRDIEHYKDSWIAQPDNNFENSKHNPAKYLGYFHGLMGIEATNITGEKKEFFMRTRCNVCNRVIKEYKSDADIRLTINTDTNAGEYPTELCPCCREKELKHFKEERID